MFVYMAVVLVVKSLAQGGIYHLIVLWSL